MSDVYKDIFSPRFSSELKGNPILFATKPEELGGALKSGYGQDIYLRHYHTFGRSTSCHTSIVRKDISRLHFIIFWKHDRWYIQDKSTNGVWVNDQKLILNNAKVLEKDDTIVFSTDSKETYTMSEIHEPCDLMLGTNPSHPPIYLEKPITIFSEEVSFIYEGFGWNLVSYDDDSKDSKLMKDGEYVKIDSHEYRLQANNQEFETFITRPTAKSIDELEFRLNVSNDDEDIQLHIIGAGQSSVIKGVRLQSQLYLMLCLARKAIYDTSQGFNEVHCGWIKLNELSKMFGIEPENTRIRLHRLRTRLREMINLNGLDACEILQLQDNEVRLNTSNVTVMKGDKPELNFG